MHVPYTSYRYSMNIGLCFCLRRFVCLQQWRRQGFCKDVTLANDAILSLDDTSLHFLRKGALFRNNGPKPEQRCRSTVYMTVESKLNRSRNRLMRPVWSLSREIRADNGSPDTTVHMTHPSTDHVTRERPLLTRADTKLCVASKRTHIG